MSKKNWFEVSAEGLSQLQEGRNKKFVAFELISNAWDQNVTKVDIDFHQATSRLAEIVVVDDDPDGFRDLAEAYTLFASSSKKANPTQRGRFNLGEKLVLAICENAVLETTQGTLLFLKSGGRSKGRRKRPAGSKIACNVRMTKEEFETTCAAIRTLIVPSNIATTFNGEVLPTRVPCHTFKPSLPTLVSDEQGVLREKKKSTIVNLYEPLEGEVAHIYEMGIPICETGDKYHVDIQQKVPVQMDRENVSDNYLRTIRTLVMNETINHLTAADATSPWALEAAQDPRVSDEAIKKSLDLRFGEKRVSYDPSDPEANDTAQINGYTVIHGRTLSSQEWDNAKRAKTVVSAGSLFPTHGLKVGCPPIPPSEWSPGMHAVVRYAKMLAKELMAVSLHVTIVKGPNQVGTVASYNKGKDGSSGLMFNLTRTGKSFFDNVMQQDLLDSLIPVDDLLIHEFSHEYEASHKNASGWDALSRLGARLKRLALVKPHLFSPDEVRKRLKGG